ATGDDKTIAVDVIRARGLLRRRIITGRERAHGIELQGLGPMGMVGAASKNQALLAELNLLHRRADTVGTGGTGRRNGVIDSTNAKRGRQYRGQGAVHAPGDTVGTGAAYAAGTEALNGLQRIIGGGTTGAHDDAGRFGMNFRRSKACIG